MNQPPQPPKRNPGKFSFEDNKLRISNLDGISSVLFEDISSISYKSNSMNDMKWIWLSILFMIIFVSLGISYDNSTIGVLGYICFLGGIIYSFMNKIKWDDVTVETRGGKLLSYSVDIGEGENQVEEIEKLKREITQK
jgi:hypothetical protein